MTRTPAETRNNPELTRVEALVEGRVVGFSQYHVEPDGSLCFFHTEVDDDREGQGIGSQLAEGVVKVARDEGVRIIPECSFIRSYLRRHEDAQDVVAEGASLTDAS
jgi:predicted GNAT family acetyltransferase